MILPWQGLLNSSISVCMADRKVELVKTCWVYFQNCHKSCRCAIIQEILQTCLFQNSAKKVSGCCSALAWVCCTGLGPHQLGLISTLERIQKLALRICAKDWSASYEDLLIRFDLPTLRWRYTVTRLMIFIAVANVLAITRRYYKLFTKNLVLYKYLSLDIIRFAFYSGIQRVARRVL